MNPGSVSIPDCSNVLGEKFIQIVRHLKALAFNGIIAPAFLTTTLCFFP
jgi:hypothetical protein